MRRNGIAKLWLILVLPCMVVALCLIIEVSNLWIARAELETALEAAALAAVDDWGDTMDPDTQNARTIGVNFAAANTVRGAPLVIVDNYDNTAPIADNQNDSCTGDLVFGAITTSSDPHTFDAGGSPTCTAPAVPYAVRAQKRVAVPSICMSLFGVSPGMFTVQAETYAVYNCSDSSAKLIRVTTFTCP